MLCVRYIPPPRGERGVRLGGTEGGLRSSFGWNGVATFGTEKCLGCICYGSWLVMVLVFGIIGFGILVWYFGIGFRYFGIIVAGQT